MFEGQLLEYYKFKKTHDLLSRDATNSSLTRGHELKYERLLEETTNDLLTDPSTKIPELSNYITTERENGNSTGKYFIGLLDSLKSRLLDEDFSNMQYFRELEIVILEPSETNSDYLSYLSEKTGNKEPLQDEEYTKWFNNKPWNQGLLKFYGDTLYFTRQFDKAIEIYTRILKDTSLSGLKGGTLGKYNSFYESEVRNKLGSCYLIQKNYKESAHQFYKASTLTDIPEAAVNQLFEAHSLIRDKKYDEALVILEKAKSHKFLPEELINSMLIQEAVVFGSKKEPQKVINLLKKFEKMKNPQFLLSPDNILIYKLLERAYKKIGDIKKAEETKEKRKGISSLIKSENLDPLLESYDKYVTNFDFILDFFIDIDIDANGDGKIDDLDEAIEETQGGMVKLGVEPITLMINGNYINVKLTADPIFYTPEFKYGSFYIEILGIDESGEAMTISDIYFPNIPTIPTKNKYKYYFYQEYSADKLPKIIKIIGTKVSKKVRDIIVRFSYYNSEYACENGLEIGPDEPFTTDTIKLTVYGITKIKLISPWTSWNYIDDKINQYLREIKINITTTPSISLNELFKKHFYLKIHSSNTLPEGYKDNLLQNANDIQKNRDNSITITYSARILKTLGVLPISTSYKTFTSCDNTTITPDTSNSNDSNKFDELMKSMGFIQNGKARDNGDYNKFESAASFDYMTYAGVQHLWVSHENIRSENRQFTDQSNWLYWSGHGHHATASLDVIDGSFNPKYAKWNKNLEVVIISGCSVLDIKDYRAQSYTFTTYTAWKLAGGDWSPGKEYENKGPQYFLGYNWKGPKDISGTDKLVKKFLLEIKKGISIPEAWKLANPITVGPNACVIDCSKKPYEYWYWDEKTGEAIWTKVKKGVDGW
jgi:hypothetical protein